MDAPDFSVENFMSLEPAERVQLCRSQAQRARTLSESASADHRSGYAELAKQWELLAQEMERAQPHGERSTTERMSRRTPVSYSSERASVSVASRSHFSATKRQESRSEPLHMSATRRASSARLR
jgi:hypothetical protein